MMVIKNLVIGLINICSLGTGHEELLAAMEQHNVDVLGINETWLKEGEEGRAPKFTGYRLVHIPRPSHVRGRGGGVGFYVRNSLNVKVLKHPCCLNVEQMWITLNIRCKKLVIGTAYRPPWLNVDTFVNAIHESVASFSWADNTIVMGDFNINFADKSTIGYRKLLEFLTMTSLTQIINQPTHFTDHSETIIDLICTDINVQRISVNHINDLSHHAFVSCELYIAKDKCIPLKIQYRPIKDINMELFETAMSSINWDAIIDHQDINNFVSNFNSIILSIYDCLAPIKHFLVKNQNYPWITYNIRLLMRRRNDAYTRAKYSKKDSHKLYYLELKKEVANAIEREKICYFETFVNTNFNNPRILWNNIKKNVNISRSTDNALPEHLRKPDDINRHFLDIPGRSCASKEDIDFFLNNKKGTSLFSFAAVSKDEVFKHFRSLHSNAIGYDGISLDMLKLSLPFTLETITNIINTSLKTCTFPSTWRKALIKPLPKTNNPNCLKDLRPISILPCLSKILEKVVCEQVRRYLDLNDMLPTRQSGFRKQNSTITALLDVVDNMLEAQDRGEGSLLILLDYSRAFDCINIDLLLCKLSYYGFDDDSLQWFKSYLSYRSQMVELKAESSQSACSSAWAEVSRGVPQGSILGPLLFILYTADVTQCIRHCKYHMYADDIQLYLSFKASEMDIALERLHDDLSRISVWSESNCLSLNSSKTKYMIIGSTHQINSILAQQPTIFLNGDPIERVTEVRNLGVVFDEGLRFHKHILNISKKLFLPTETALSD
ncbi:unnamed protein product [Colias eurytheme]|nr:unnamed protein product [Colias eurytheme]